MALWMGPGRKVLARVWARPRLALALCCVLSDLGWGGWKLLALPQVVKALPDLLDAGAHTGPALELLGAAQREKRLQVDAPWKARLQTWFERRLEGWVGDAEQVRVGTSILLGICAEMRFQAVVLHHAIALSELLPGLSPLLVGIVNATLKQEDPKADYDEHETNSSWIIGSCLACLARRNSTEWRGQVDIPAWTATIVEKWGWSGYALEGLVSLSNARHVFWPPLSYIF